MRLFAIFLLCSSCFGQSVAINGRTSISGNVSINPPPPSGPVITNTTAGLVNWWKFDENAGTTAADSSGSSPGSFPGAGHDPTWVAGQINSALSFGANQWLQLDANTAAGVGAFSFSAWVKPDNGSGTFIYDSNDDNDAGFFFYASSGILDVTIVFSGNLLERSGGNIPANQWTHIAFTWAGSTTATTLKIYTNAVELGAYAISADGSGAHNANTTTSRYLARSGVGAGVDFLGIIDDPRVWNRVLSAGEITNMFQWRGEP